MEVQENHNYNTNSRKMKHFAKLHERIQNKYEEMQRRLEKSKSIDSLPSLKEEYLYQETKYRSNNDLREADEVFYSESLQTAGQSLKHDVIIEHIHVNDAISQDVNFKEASISESEGGLTPNGKHKNEIDANFPLNDFIFFNDNFSKTSLESLNEVTKESDENLTPPTPPPRISIRNKIGSRISAVKEKRRREEQERNATKDKKKESREKVEKFILSNTTKQDIIRIPKRIKMATVTVALIEATGLENESSEEKSRILYCRFRLGNEKLKSKTAKSNASVVKWHELLSFNLYEENMLEILLFDKDMFLGRSVMDLSEMQREKTHKMRINMEGEMANVQIFMLLTISGTSLVNTVIDLDDYQETQRRIDSMRRKFAWYRLRDDYTDVGCLSIIVYGAKGLSGSDCYCVLELGNERLQTHTDFKTNDPNWMKIFTFVVTDITSILEVTVCEERKSEVIGKISIPLLKIQNGRKKWYSLKDQTQRDRAKGHYPRILLEMRVAWNLVKSSIRVINPKEIKYIKTVEKFDRHLFAQNLSRARAVLNWVLDAFKVVKTCFEWESRKWNVIALTIWLTVCWFFKAWMLPIILLLPFIWYRPEKYYLINWKRFFRKNNENKELEEIKNEKEEKNTSLRSRINSLQEMVQSVQNAIGKFASLGESIKNLFNFTVPYLSCLAIFIILVISFVMYLVPVNYIFMIWGIHKFTRKILRPNRIPNNEILDLLSRVPDDNTLLDCEEFNLNDISDDESI